MKPVSILVDPGIGIDDVRVALKHSSLAVEPTAFPQLFVIKATPSSPTDETVRAAARLQAGGAT